MIKKNVCVSVAMLLTLVLFTGCGSLWRSTLRGDAEGVKYYAEKGEAVEQLDRYGWTPLMWACYYQYYEVADVLLEKGANPNAQTKHKYGSIAGGSTPLIISTYYGWANGVRMLLRFGANKNLADALGQTPFKVAEKYNFSEIMEYLTKGVGHTTVVAKKQETVPPEENKQVILLNDGSKIVGTIVSQTRTTVTVKTKYSTMTIEKDKISEMKYK